MASPSLPEAEAAALGLDARFDDQSAAERWLTAGYLDLADRGVVAVSLFEEDRLLYGPMSLEA